jgi:hypothetical protein
MRGIKASLRTASLLFTVAVCFVMIWHWLLWTELPIILARDTLWHLSPSARVMLVALSTCAVLATALCCLVKSIWFEQRFCDRSTFRPLRWIGAYVLDLTTTLVLLWGAITVAPQLFYTLYVSVIPGLPRQWVAKPIDVVTLTEFLRLTPADSMATLLVGVMMLSILVASIFLWLSVPAKHFNSIR